MFSHSHIGDGEASEILSKMSLTRPFNNNDRANGPLPATSENRFLSTGQQQIVSRQKRASIVGQRGGKFRGCTIWFTGKYLVSVFRPVNKFVFGLFYVLKSIQPKIRFRYPSSSYYNCVSKLLFGPMSLFRIVRGRQNYPSIPFRGLLDTKRNTYLFFGWRQYPKRCKQRPWLFSG